MHLQKLYSTALVSNDYFCVDVSLQYFLYFFFEKAYILYNIQFICFTELVLVQIYEHPVVEGASPLWDDVFKYRPIDSDRVQANDAENVAEWRRPMDGRLRSIRLYATARFCLKKSI